MATQTQLKYENVPSIGLYLSRTKASDEKGRTIVNISWYDTKLWVKERGLVLPTSRQWSEARAYFEKSYPEIEKSMIENEVEWTDSLIAWPNPDSGIYASNINPKPKSGKVPLLIEGSVVEKTKKGYVIDGGERKELLELPTSNGTLRNSILELGLIKDAYLWSDPDFSREEGLKAVVRGYGWYARDWRFFAYADWRPSYSYANLGFRPARRGLVGDEKDTNFVRVPREEVERLYDMLGRLLGKQ